jgi:hypothetical protein
MTPKSKAPQRVNAYSGAYSEGRPPAAFNDVKAGYMVRCWRMFNTN